MRDANERVQGQGTAKSAALARDIKENTASDRGFFRDRRTVARTATSAAAMGARRDSLRAGAEGLRHRAPVFKSWPALSTLNFLVMGSSIFAPKPNASRAHSKVAGELFQWSQL
jgi:hypothetical protein